VTKPVGYPRSIAFLNLFSTGCWAVSTCQSDRLLATASRVRLNVSKQLLTIILHQMRGLVLLFEKRRQCSQFCSALYSTCSGKVNASSFVKHFSHPIFLYGGSRGQQPSEVSNFLKVFSKRVVLLASHQDRAKQGWRCNQATCPW